MHRIDSATADQDLFGAGKDGFTEGNPGTGTPPTHLTHSWFNDVQEELCNFIEGQGITLVKGTVTQLLAALRAPVGPAGTATPAVSGTGGSNSGPGLKGTGGATNGIGVVGQGTGTGCGVEGNGASSPIGTAATTGSGVVGRGGQTNGYGGEFFGKGSGEGVRGTGGSSNGAGVRGWATGTAPGVYGNNDGSSGGGVYGSISNAGTGAAVKGEAFGTGNANGVEGVAKGSGDGVKGTGGATSGAIGVRGVGGSTNGVGVKGEGIGTGHAVYGVGVNGHGVVAESDTTSPAKAALRIVPQNANPATSPADGDVFVESTTGRMRLRTAMDQWEPVVTQTFTVVNQDGSEANTSFTTISGATFTIPANSLRVGSRIKMTALLRVHSVTDGFRFRINATGFNSQLLDLNNYDPGSAQTWFLWITMDCRVLTVGASGTVAGRTIGQKSQDIADAGDTITGSFGGSGMTTLEEGFFTNEDIDTTAAITIELQELWAGTAGAGDNVKVVFMDVEVT